MKRLLGSRTRHPGWTTLDLAAGPEVDHDGDCTDLSAFADDSIATLYASHVPERVPCPDLQRTLKEWHRVRAPDGKAMIAVPDMNILAQLFVKPEIRGQASPSSVACGSASTSRRPNRGGSYAPMSVASDV